MLQDFWGYTNVLHVLELALNLNDWKSTL